MKTSLAEKFKVNEICFSEGDSPGVKTSFDGNRPRASHNHIIRRMKT